MLSGVRCALLLSFAMVTAADARDNDLGSPQGNELYVEHLRQARFAAKGLAAGLIDLCEIPGTEKRPNQLRSASQRVEAGWAFDNLAYVGLAGVSAWALSTSEGIILIDALNYPHDAEETIFPAMRALGLDPDKIRFVVVTHGHADHFGAARHLQLSKGVRVIASSADWSLMEGPSPFPNAPYREPPKRDMVVSDGEHLTLGDTTVEFRVTPGHTPGTLSLLFPVHAGGKSHVAALWGGTGFNFKPTAANFATYGRSAVSFRDLAGISGADVFLSNHPFVDRTVENLAILKRGTWRSNPFVIGKQGVSNVLTVAAECAFARAALL